MVSTFTEIFNSDPDQLNSVTKFPCAGQKHALFVPHHGQKGKVGTPIDVSADSSGYSPHPDCEDLLFSLTGKESGLLYSIELRFYSERAKLLAGKMTELMEANNFYQISPANRRKRELVHHSSNDYTPLRHFVEALELMSFRVFVQRKRWRTITFALTKAGNIDLARRPDSLPDDESQKRPFDIPGTIHVHT